MDAARKLSAEDYTLADAENPGSLDLPRVYELYRAGATISIRHLHESLLELAALCRAVEQMFSGHFQTNIYLSPPNAQGFGTHFDSHDVFVLQVVGSLPVGFANADFDATEARATFRRLLDKFARQAELDPILQGLAEEFVTSRRPDLGGSLQEIDAPAKITGNSGVQARPHLIYGLRRDAKGGNLTCIGSRSILEGDFPQRRSSWHAKDPPYPHQKRSHYRMPISFPSAA